MGRERRKMTSNQFLNKLKTLAHKRGLGEGKCWKVTACSMPAGRSSQAVPQPAVLAPVCTSTHPPPGLPCPIPRPLQGPLPPLTSALQSDPQVEPKPNGRLGGCFLPHWTERS